MNYISLVIFSDSIPLFIILFKMNLFLGIKLNYRDLLSMIMVTSGLKERARFLRVDSESLRNLLVLEKCIRLGFPLALVVLPRALRSVGVVGPSGSVRTGVAGVTIASTTAASSTATL